MNSSSAWTRGAALTIDTSNLLTEEHRRERWLQAALEMTRLLLGDVDRREALRVVTGKLREVSGADYAAIVSDEPIYPEDTVVFEAVDGLGLEWYEGTPVPKQGLTAEVIRTGAKVVSQDITHEEGYDPPVQVAEALSALGLGMYLPLVAAGRMFGALIVGWRRGSPHERVAAEEAPLVEMFAGHAALALQQVQARLLVMEDRERIATDLHDSVIDRLFAIASHLYGVACKITRTDIQQQMHEAIDELDEATRQIRTAIFALRHESEAEARAMETPSGQILEEIDAARNTFGFTPRLVVHGPLDRPMPARVQRELVRAVREALANAAAHATPTTVEVNVDMTPRGVALVVTDDSHLMEHSTLHGALVRVHTRAASLGGACTVRPRRPTGTILEWRVPLAS
ncbi:GAF domain-containing protein [Actinopolymorpha pittospori]|uniref:Signal transduction histidine kinase n=1 Tax=Actinopolymorpha pittospori TaxID=648752 RepID=A0A927N6U7_9ACTN|nr:signal transduction histidine kinase [Actinopolymorpha pittospori]